MGEEKGEEREEEDEEKGDKDEKEEEEGQEKEFEDEDEVLLAMMARLGCEKMVLKGVERESNPNAGQVTSGSLSLLEDESSQTPATASGSHTPSQQMQEDRRQPPFSCQEQTDSMLVLNSSFEEEDD